MFCVPKEHKKSKKRAVQTMVGQQETSKKEEKGVVRETIDGILDYDILEPR